MLNDFLQIYTLSIVLVGEFNPVIIQPFWLANKKLIREVEAETAKIELIHNEIVRFEIDWAKIEITRNKFEIRTSQEPFFEPLKDLVTGIFTILKETPIIAFGINHVKYYALPDYDRYYALGNKLAPLSNWDDVLNDPRMLILEIIEQQRKDKLAGQVRIRIVPSDIPLATNYGIVIQYNDHFDYNQNTTKRDRTLGIIELIGSVWNDSSKRANEVIETMWSKVNI